MRDRKHLGDGAYVYYNGFAYEFQANHHENPTVLTMEDDAIDALIRFREQIRESKGGIIEEKEG